MKVTKRVPSQPLVNPASSAQARLVSFAAWRIIKLNLNIDKFKGLITNDNDIGKPTSAIKYCRRLVCLL